MESPLWTDGASPWPHERDALAFVRARLPNIEPYRAWTNVEFIAEDGSVNEVDLLVITGKGLFVVEIKSWPGVLRGSGQLWTNRRPNGREYTMEHPLLLANRKAKRLKSILARQSALRKEPVPFVTALIFLSSPELTCHLDAVAASSVCGRDRDPPSPKPPGTALPGIVAALKDPTSIGQRGQLINRPLSAKLAQALTQAGLGPSNRGRRAGDWLLGDLLDEGPGWQDFQATRPDATATRRVRLYLSAAATTAEDEQRLRDEADREFQMVQDLRHTGIARPLDLVQTERGPGLFFDRAEGEERLDLWAPTHVSSFPLEERLELVRQIAEALAHAHGHRVTHRALSAGSVLVHPGPAPGAPPALVVGHWQAGAREMATRLTAHGADAATMGGSSLADRLSATEQVYLAPETFCAERPDAVALDTFSLGALAFLLLAGRPPAADLAERDALLAAGGGLTLHTAVDGLPESVDILVSSATDPVPAQRPSLREVLELLDDALEKCTAPAPELVADEPVLVDPLEAHGGAELANNWQVIRRLGSGSTAMGLLCRRTGDTAPSVLKVARDEGHAERLLEEARTLGRLRHAGIVECFGIEKVSGRTVLHLACAGDPDDRAGMTLADRLLSGGRLNPDLLERFGDDLIEIVAFLEGMGTPHRDIKPDNLGVRPRPADKSLHLVLFDFSLSATPDTNLHAGTPGYLDPFLPERPARRWDTAAERYAVAVTLHEMATGTRPVWGDGATDPIHLPDAEPNLDPTLFDPAVRDDLTGFLARALHRQPGLRFDTAEDMRRAWRSVFAGARRPTTSSADGTPDEATLVRLAEAAGPNTPVAELGLSGAAVSALERLGVGTVAQLLEYPTADWYRTPGTGLRIRKEVADAVTRLRSRADAPPAEPEASIDRIARVLIPQPSTSQARADQHPLEVLLGLDSAAQLLLGTNPATAAPVAWPGLHDVKTRCDLDRARYDALMERARARWLKEPKLTQVRIELAAILERSSGILSGDELAMALRVQRGSADPGPMLLPRARAVVRAALEAEAARTTNRFTWRRLAGGGSCVVALRTEGLEGEDLADYAAALGTLADRLAANDPLLGPGTVLEDLRGLRSPAGLPPLSDHRLVRLAASASATAGVSSRLELYPRGMAAERAVLLARNALLVPGTLSVDDLRTRIRTRFPESAPLPDRPALDTLIEGAVGLVWHEGGADESGVERPPGFRIPRPAAAASMFTGSGTVFATGATANVDESRRTVAANTQDRLARHAANGGYLVITVSTRRHEQAVGALAAFGPAVLSVERLLIAHLREVTTEKGAKWERGILPADAVGPAGPNWLRLLAPVREAVDLVQEDVMAAGRHVLLTYPGLLGRYDALGLLDVLRDAIYRPEPGQTLETLWVLVPSDDPGALPTIGVDAVPYTASTEWLVLTEDWLRNLHQTHQPPGAA